MFPLQLAVKYNRTEMVKLLINEMEKSDFYPTDYNWTGTTPFHLAAANDNLEIMKVLLDSESDNINLFNSPYNGDVKTPLDCAKSEEIRSLLRAHGGKTGKEIREQENKETREE